MTIARRKDESRDTFFALTRRQQTCTHRVPDAYAAWTPETLEIHTKKILRSVDAIRR
jgi:hypothetical protein